MITVKNILLLEDELSVVSKFVSVIKKNNSETFLNNNGILLSLAMDSSTIGFFDLNDFDYIFVDRDNALNREGNFHKYYLSLLKRSSGNLIDISKKTYPMSGSLINNDSLNNEIIKVLINTEDLKDKREVKYYIQNRKSANELTEILKKNYITKSSDNVLDKLNGLFTTKDNIKNTSSVSNTFKQF